MDEVKFHLIDEQGGVAISVGPDIVVGFVLSELVAWLNDPGQMSEAKKLIADFVKTCDAPDPEGN